MTGSKMTDNETEIFLEYVTELGKRMVECGAEVHRAEDMTKRICRAYEFEDCQVFATTAQLTVSIKSDSGRHCIWAVRITRTANDLGELERVNAISRKICAEKPALCKIKKILDKKPQKTNPFFEMLGFMIPAGAFTVFFGGSIKDGICAAILGIAVFIADRFSRIKQMSTVIYTIFACFAVGLSARFLCRIGVGDNSDFIMIGLIMLFIPTLSVVNGVREIFLRDIITGVCRLTEAIMTTAAITLGFAAAVFITGGGTI